MTLVEAFGICVRAERIRQGLTQQELADRAGLHINFVSLVERAKAAAALDSIALIAASLGKTPSQLLRAAERAMAGTDES